MYEIKFNYKAVPAWWLDLTNMFSSYNYHTFIMLNKHADSAVLGESEMFIIGVVF